jgi:GDP-L-fucose synthase
MNIFVAGHNGMVGSAIFKELANTKCNLLCTSRSELDLLDQKSVKDYFDTHKIDQVYLAAAKVGGIYANNEFPAEFIYQNLTIQTNIIHSAHQAGVDKLLFLGSSCIYPKFASQPMKENALLTGALEETNEPYAIAKIAGIKLCESYNRQYGRDYRSVMPTNLYGPNDNFHPQNSHVIPALMNRFHNAVINNEKEVVIWGSGIPKREFLHVKDMALACMHIMNLDKDLYQSKTKIMLSHVNIGSGVDCSIKELALTMAKVTKFNGEIVFDTSKPDGTPRKLMDVSRLNDLGWKYSIGLEQGLSETYSWYVSNFDKIRS